MNVNNAPSARRDMLPMRLDLSFAFVPSISDAVFLFATACVIAVSIPGRAARVRVAMMLRTNWNWPKNSTLEPRARIEDCARRISAIITYELPSQNAPLAK